MPDLLKQTKFIEPRDYCISFFFFFFFCFFCFFLVFIYYLTLGVFY